MPISLSAKKSLRKSIKNRKANVTLKNKMKLIIKTFLSKPTEKGLNETFSAMDKAKKKGLLHKNKVSRLKSQFSKKIGSSAVAKVNPAKAGIKKANAKKTAAKKTAKAKMSK